MDAHFSEYLGTIAGMTELYGVSHEERDDHRPDAAVLKTSRRTSSTAGDCPQPFLTAACADPTGLVATIVRA